MIVKYISGGHFGLGCHFHVHFSNLLQAIAPRGLPAIAELLVAPTMANFGDVLQKISPLSYFLQ